MVRSLQTEPVTRGLKGISEMVSILVTGPKKNIFAPIPVQTVTNISYSIPCSRLGQKYDNQFRVHLIAIFTE